MFLLFVSMLCSRAPSSLLSPTLHSVFSAACI